MKLLYRRSVIIMKLRKDLSCSKCCRNIKPSRVIIVNKKLVCPFCYRTIETNKSRVEFVEELHKALEKGSK